MKLPNLESAVVSEEKVTGYLLSAVHRDGRHKAAFFVRFGYSTDHWQELAATLRDHARNNDVAQVQDSPFGTRYVVEGIINAPDGRSPTIRAIWFVENGEDVPRLISAYPRKRN
jgi:hypothetical protein